MKDFNPFHHLLTEYGTLLDELIAFENEKTATLSTSNMSKIDTLMKEEQVYLLKLRGLDAKREKLQTEMDMKNLTFSDIIASCEEPQKLPLQEAYDSLNRKTETLKKISESTKRFIEIHRHSLELLINDLGGEATILASYDKNGSQPAIPSAKFEGKRV